MFNNSVIDKIFYGCKSLGEEEPTEKYSKLCNKSILLFKKLCEELSQEQQKDLKEYLDAHIQMEDDSSYRCFKAGVKVGFEFALENLLD